MTEQPEANEREMVNAAQPVPLRTVRSSLQEMSDFDKLLATGEKLLRYQQSRAIQAESDYQKQRTAVIDGCRVRMDRMKQEVEEELRQLDLQHKAAMDQFGRVINALKGLRGA